MLLQGLGIVRGFGVIGVDAFEFEGGELVNRGAVEGLELGELFVLLGDDSIEIITEFFKMRQAGFHAEEALFESFVHGNKKVRVS